MIKTIKDVREEVNRIKTMVGDDEAAHSTEDALYIAVLNLIADGAEDAPQLAKTALKTQKLDFARWCA